jgi:hypothetical protein
MKFHKVFGIWYNRPKSLHPNKSLFEEFLSKGDE